MDTGKKMKLNIFVLKCVKIVILLGYVGIFVSVLFNPRSIFICFGLTFILVIVWNLIVGSVRNNVEKYFSTAISDIFQGADFSIETKDDIILQPFFKTNVITGCEPGIHNSIRCAIVLNKDDYTFVHANVEYINHLLPKPKKVSAYTFISLSTTVEFNNRLLIVSTDKSIVGNEKAIINTINRPPCKIETNNVIFDEMFNVYCYNTIEGFLHLPPLAVERLLVMRKRYGAYNLVLFGTRIYVVFDRYGLFVNIPGDWSELEIFDYEPMKQNIEFLQEALNDVSNALSNHSELTKVF